MSEQRIVTIIAIILGVLLYYAINAFIIKRYPVGLKYVRISGLVYLSVVIVLMFIVRLRPTISIYQILLIEGIALMMHLLVICMMIFILNKYKQIDTIKSEQKHAEHSQYQKFEKDTPVNLQDENKDGSDIETE